MIKNIGGNMKYIGLTEGQENISMELAEKINNEFMKADFTLLSKYVWDNVTYQIIKRADTLGIPERRFLPALTISELGKILPNNIATMRVNHKEYGRKLYLCDHIHNIRFGARSREEFHFEEVEARGIRFLQLIIDNPELLVHIKNGAANDKR